MVKWKWIKTMERVVAWRWREVMREPLFVVSAWLGLEKTGRGAHTGFWSFVVFGVAYVLCHQSPSQIFSLHTPPHTANPLRLPFAAVRFADTNNPIMQLRSMREERRKETQKATRRKVIAATSLYTITHYHIHAMPCHAIAIAFKDKDKRQLRTHPTLFAIGSFLDLPSTVGPSLNHKDN